MSTSSTQVSSSPLTSSSTSSSANDRYKFVFFAPTANLPAIKAAVFATGAGKYPGPGNYTECCFCTTGTGEFRPGDTANPAIGERGKLESVEEVRVETICLGRQIVKDAVEAMKKYTSLFSLSPSSISSPSALPR